MDTAVTMRPAFAGRLEKSQKQTKLQEVYIPRDIRWAFSTTGYDDPVDGMENKYLRLGFSRAGNFLEIM